MKRIEINHLFLDTVEPLIDTTINVKGWVRTKRGNKNVAFIALNDGSTINNIQIVVDLANFDDDLLRRITTGACISVDGKLVKSQGAGQNVEIQMVPLLVVKHFCESNKDITWKDLQIAFDTVECHMPKYLDWITPKPIVEAYYSSFPPPGGKPIRRFHDDPIHLASGETILVVSRLMFYSRFDFSSFLKVSALAFTESRNASSIVSRTTQAPAQATGFIPNVEP